MLPFLSSGYRAFMYNSPVLLILTSVLAIIIELAILCNKDLGRRVPTNYILLGTFTLCESYMVSFTASVYDPSIVVTAAFMTAGVVTGLTVYAYKSERDYTLCGGVMSMIFFALVTFCIFALIFQAQILTTFYCLICVVIFGFYIIFDT
jgi:FtsH-binding integral membrane protein